MLLFASCLPLSKNSFFQLFEKNVIIKWKEGGKIYEETKSHTHTKVHRVIVNKQSKKAR